MRNKNEKIIRDKELIFLDTNKNNANYMMQQSNTIDGKLPGTHVEAFWSGFGSDSRSALVKDSSE